ncbi:MAG: glycosyltransferase family 4 protein [Polyangiaceae bacterium]|nr:glycosyltransferase family 4 protein [Polyangiaceae bacterium]
MHIVWVNEKADFVGGAERYVASTASHLRERGHQCTLLYRAGTWVAPKFARNFDGMFPMVDVGRQLRELGPDVIYVHQLRGVDALRPFAESSYPVVRFIHDHRLMCLREHKITTIGKRTCSRVVGAGCYACLGFVTRGEKSPIRFRGLSALRNELSMNHGLRRILVGSEYMRQHVLQHGFLPARVRMIPLYVDPMPVPAVAREPNQLLFVGSLLRGKGLDVLLRALTALPDVVRLDVLGEGSQGGVFKRTVSSLGLSARVRFLGRREPSEVRERMARCSCVVIPSREPESFSFVGPEALLAEAPVVASRVGGTGEWLHDNVTAFAVEPGCYRALARAIRKVLANEENAASSARAGRDLVVSRFSRRAHLDGLIQQLSFAGAAA